MIFCITPEPQLWGTDSGSTSWFLPHCSRRMLELYPRLAELRVRRVWRGSYPMTPDGQPIVGYAPGVENLMLAAGMCGQGFMIGPGLGLILAEVLALGRGARGGANGFILDQLRPDRNFDGMELLK